MTHSVLKTMNYEKHYKKLFNKAKNRTLGGSVEKHHFIPKSVFHTHLKVEISNILDIPIPLSVNCESHCFKLTLKEHFVAHLLLFKMFKHESLIFAANMMLSFYGSSCNYVSIRKHHKAVAREKNIGMGNYIDNSNNIVRMPCVDAKVLGLRGSNYNHKHKKVVCQHCNKTVGSNSLTIHQSFCRNQPSSASCVFCKQQFTLNYFHKHVKHCGKNPNSIKNKYSEQRICKFCSASISYTMIKKHESCCDNNENRIFTSRTPTNCVFCGELKDATHMSRCEHNPNKLVSEHVKCVHCGKVAHVSHMNVCKLNPNAPCHSKSSCKTCGKSITTYNLQRHEQVCVININKQNDKLRLNCKYCGKKYEKLKSRRSHEANCNPTSREKRRIRNEANANKI